MLIRAHRQSTELQSCIYLQGDSVVDKVNETLRLTNEVYFSVRTGMSSSKKKSDKVYDIGDNLLLQTKLSVAKIGVWLSTASIKR